MRGATKSRLLASCVMQNEQVDLTLFKKHFPRALEIYMSHKSGFADVAANCVVYSTQTSSYKTTPVAAITGVENHHLHTRFCVNFQEKLQEDEFAKEAIFSDKATFHVSGKVNSHKERIEHATTAIDSDMLQ